MEKTCLLLPPPGGTASRQLPYQQLLFMMNNAYLISIKLEIPTVSEYCSK